jgi:phospholipase/lecithinase/hemolysin
MPSGAYYFDTIGLSDQLLANPSLFGLPAGINTTTACLAGGGAPPAGPPTCDGYAFFDNVHPTTQVQQLLGAQILTLIPEPGTAVLMMTGLAWLSATRRRTAV